MLGPKSQSRLLAFGAIGACPEGGRAMKGMWPLPTMLPKADRGKDPHSSLPLLRAVPSSVSVKMSDGRGRPPECTMELQGQQMDLSTNGPKANTSAKLK